MKKAITLILVLLVLVSVSGAAFAYGDVAGEGSGATCGASISWALQGSTLYITGYGDMYDFYGGAPWSNYKYTIGTVIISDGVTSVGAYAFQDCDFLTNVQFGNSIVTIGQDAFSSCDGLTSITLPASFKKFGENSFRSCTNLKEIHCNGNFPRFDNNSMWDTHATIYFPATNPWPVSAIEQLETAFQGRIEFRSSDGTDPYQPTESWTQETWETQSTWPQETWETWATEGNWIIEDGWNQPTVSDEPIVFTRPEYTEPATIPVETAPTTIPTLPPQTLPAVTQPTQETFLLGNQPTQPAAPASRGTDGNSVFGLLLVLLTLCILATGALIFRAASHSRRNGRGGRYGR